MSKEQIVKEVAKAAVCTVASYLAYAATYTLIDRAERKYIKNKDGIFK